MKIGVAKETAPGERRVALVPEALGKLKAAGLDILVERGAGAGSSFPDSEYEAAGATIVSTDDLYRDADAVLRVAKPSAAEVGRLRQGQAVLGLLSPLIDPATAKALADAGITAISLDAIPRTLSRAQTMDALSSQANVGGYKAVLIAANAYPRYFPLLTTAAGTAKPANVLILGIGVAGLQAIGTAKRLGAVVHAYDVRPETREQAESLGAKFVKLKTTIDATGSGGYARELTAEERAAQQAELNEAIVGMAAAALGGNCELSKAGETVVTPNGVTIVAPDNLPASMPSGASAFYARNISSLLLGMVKDGALNLDFEDEVTKATVITHGGEILSDPVKKLLEPAPAAAGGPA